MKQYFFTILCTCLTIHVFADVPPLSRSDLQNVTITADNVSNASSMNGVETAKTPKLFKRDLNKKSIKGRSLQHQSIEDLKGDRIASYDAYDFYWDGINGIAIIDTTFALKGSYCEITGSLSSENKVFLSYFYSTFLRIPMEIDDLSDSVTIKAGHALASIHTVESVLQPMLSHNTRNQEGIKAVWTLYAMPLSWLMGDDNYRDIHGHVEIDGTIKFDDDFAFLVRSEDEEGYLIGWRLSPVYKNLRLLNPNGSHSFIYRRPSSDGDDVIGPIGNGNGGLVPRKPGKSKPVSPRPFTPINSLIGSCNFYSGSRFITDLTKMNVNLVHRFLDEGLGNGGLVPRKPGSCKPVSTNPEETINMSHPSCNNVFLANSGSDHILDLNLILPDSIINPPMFFEETDMAVPVYVYMTNDTTMMVYNLFGLGNRCHIRIDKNSGLMYLPCQAIYSSGLGSYIYNKEKTGTWSQEFITWGFTSIYNDDGDYNNYGFRNNILTFADSEEPNSETPQPTFADPVVTDNTVVFSAAAAPSYEVFLYLYDDETLDYYEVENPLELPRMNEPYLIYLAARSYNPSSSVYSETVYVEYEIPALDVPITILRGDVNGNNEIGMDDLTILINYLTGAIGPNDINFDNAAICDSTDSDTVSMDDLTALINYLLNGHWRD